MENRLKSVDFINLYHSYSEYYFPKIILNNKRKLIDEEKNKILNIYLNSKFLSDKIGIKIKNKIETSNIYDYEYRIVLDQGVIGFHFITDKSITAINKIIKYYFFVIFLRINYVNINKQLKFLDNVYINLITVNVPKKLSIPISVDDINSACTEIYPEFYGGPIYIWRTDELYKVLIHEALHSVHYDWEIIHQELIPELKNLEMHISRENGLNANESYNEAGATFLMAFFKLKSKPEDKRKEKKIIRSYIMKEIEYSFENCAKLMIKYDINDINDCNNVNLVSHCKYKQQASAYCYIILKTGILWCIMDKCKLKDTKKHTDRIRCLEEFMSMGFWGKMGASFQKLLIMILRDREFNKIINKKIKLLSHKIKKERSEKFYFTYNGSIV